MRYVGSRAWRWPTVLGLIAFCGFVLSTLVFYPGFMSYDSFNQLDQATGLLPIGDWHPPIMVLVWHALIAVFGKISSLFILDQAVAWIGYGLLATWVYKHAVVHRRRWSLAVFVVTAMPFVGVIAGVVWKDVLMAHIFVVAVAALLYAMTTTSRRIRCFLYGTVVVLCVVACLLRYNALAAAVPLIVAIALVCFKSLKWRVLAIMAPLMLVPLSIVVIGNVFHVEKDNPNVSIMLDDLVYSQRSAAPRGDETEARVAVVATKCRTKMVVSPVNAFWLCADANDRSILLSHAARVQSLWIHHVVTHPVAYVQYRVAAFAFFMNPPKANEYIWQPGIDKNDHYSLTVKYPDVSLAYYTGLIEPTIKDFGFLFRPYFWLIANVGLIILVRKWFAPRSPRRIVLTAIFASSLLYILGYFPLVIGPDYRYIYWSVIATSIGGIIAVASRPRVIRIGNKP